MIVLRFLGFKVTQLNYSLTKIGFEHARLYRGIMSAVKRNLMVIWVVGY